MGCCGCSLYASAITAVVFGFVESLMSLGIGIFLIEVGGYSSTYSEKVDLTDSISIGVSVTNQSRFVSEFFGVLLSSLFFNSFWLVTSLLLIIGIVRENSCLHKFWAIVTTLVLISDIIHLIVLVIGFVRESRTVPDNDSWYGNFLMTFVLSSTVATRNILFWIINICLIIYTYQRATEIERRGYPQHPANVFIYGGQPTHTLLVPGQSTAALPLVAYPGGDEFQNPMYRPDLPVVVQAGLHLDHKKY